MKSNRTTISLILDASESARPFWEDTITIATELIDTLPENTVEGIYLLGTSIRWEINRWRLEIPFLEAASKGSSFVTPICSLWQAHDIMPNVAVIVGSGEVFDLSDWAKDIHWILLMTGDESLRGDVKGPREFSKSELDQVITSLNKPHRSLQSARPPRLNGVVAQKWTTDRAGFPMLWIPPLSVYVALFPILKAQFETFLMQTEIADFGDQWYERLLEYNPRLPLSTSFNEYERLCLTGLLPEELQAYAEWQGPSFRYLSLQEWQIIAEWMRQQSICVPPTQIEKTMSFAARRIWAELLSALVPQTLSDLALLHHGIVEWVVDPKGNLVGMGSPRQQFQPGFAQSPWIPTSPPRRAKIWGGRLLKTTV